MRSWSFSFLVIVATCATLLAQQSPSQPANGVSDKAEQRIVKEVRHELLMIPNLDVFDNLAYKVNGYNVTLVGQVTRPTIKSDAENAVKTYRRRREDRQPDRSAATVADGRSA